VGYVFSANDTLLACGFHFFAAETEGSELRQASAQFSDKLRAVVVAAGFSGGEEDARVG